jgi:uncharacterized protein
MIDRIRFGRTGLMVSRCGFGAIPIQRISAAEAGRLLKKAYEAGITFYDTARRYSDSEEKIALALADVRKNIVIATKTRGKNPEEILRDLETSLRVLRTDFVDILQLHNLKAPLDPDDPNGAYQGLKEARRKGMTRFIGMSTHRVDVALKAADSGLYDSIQFPLSMISNEQELSLIERCREKEVGLIAMKALAGGLITDARTAFAFLHQFDALVPIWGMQRESELDEFIALEAHPPALDDAMQKKIAQYRKELSGDFCRGCGYCLPCPAEIPISQAARTSFLIGRTNIKRLLTDEWKQGMERIRDCQECGHCREECPYELDTPTLLKKQLALYEEWLEKQPKA